MDWWERNIVEPGKLPLFLCALAFVVTFATTRTIVRSIRAGRGPFRNNVSAGGTHIHHVVPGTILMVSGGTLALATITEAANAVAGILFGIGLALVLDEFALILHLDDVYWEAEGRVSVDAVFLVGGVLVLLLLGASPEGVDDLSSEVETARWIILVQLLVVFGCVVVACLKGKVISASVGPLHSPAGVVRRAPPGPTRAPRGRTGSTPTGSSREVRSLKRARRNDKLWRRPARRVQDLIAGAPSAEPPPSSPARRGERDARRGRGRRGRRRRRAGQDGQAGNPP